MKRLYEKHPGGALCGACYALGLLLLLALHFAGFVQNRVAYSNGTLAHAELSVDDFELREMVETEDGMLVATGGDPQMLLLDKERRVENVYMEVGYSLPHRQQMALWTPAGADYDIRALAYAKDQDGGTVFWLPAAGGQSLRIDPTSVPGNVMEIRRIEINRPRPFYAFFIFTPDEWLLLGVLPALAASGIELLRQGVGALRRRKAGDAA